jgi:hypothetical protein
MKAIKFDRYAVVSKPARLTFDQAAGVSVAACTGKVIVTI